jgi:hypothetical protein
VSTTELAEKFEAAMLAMEDAFIAEQRRAEPLPMTARDEAAMRLGFARGSHDAIKLAVDAGLWQEPSEDPT